MGTVIEADAKRLHEDIMDAFDGNSSKDRPTVITLFSLHDRPAGQWLIGDEKQDKKLVAKRLRQMADLLDAETTTQD